MGYLWLLVLVCVASTARVEQSNRWGNGRVGSIQEFLKRNPCRPSGVTRKVEGSAGIQVRPLQSISKRAVPTKATAMDRWTCYEEIGRSSIPVDFCGFTAMDFIHIVNHLACENDRIKLHLLECIVEDEAIVSNILSQGPFPQVEEIMRLRPSYRLALFEQLAPFMPHKMIEDALITTVIRGTNVDIFKLLLKAHTRKPMDLDRRIDFVHKMVKGIERLQYEPDWGDWNEGGPFQRFFRIVAQVTPNLIPSSTKENLKASFIINNHILLPCLSPLLLFPGECNILHHGNISESYMAIDFYLSVTDFKRANFDNEDYLQRSAALMELINRLADIAAGVLKEPSSATVQSTTEAGEESTKTQQTAQREEDRFINVLWWLFKVDAYTALEFYLNGSEISLSNSIVVELISGAENDVGPLGITQLLYHAERSFIEIPEECSQDAKELIQLYNQLMPSERRNPCGTGIPRKIRLPENFEASPEISDIFIRAYLLFWFDIPLRHTKLSHYGDSLDPVEYPGAIDALLERYCAIHHKSSPAFTHKRSVREIS